MANRQQQKQEAIAASESESTSPLEDQSPKTRNKIIETIYRSSDISDVPEAHQDTILSALDLENTPEGQLLENVQQRVDDYFNELDNFERESQKKEWKENSRQNLEKALNFFEKEVLPSIQGDLAGVKVGLGWAHNKYWHEETLVPQKLNPTLKDKYELASYFTGDIRPEPDNDWRVRKGKPKLVFDNEQNRKHESGPYDTLYVGSVPVALVRDYYNEQDDYWHNEYGLRTGPIQDRDDFDMEWVTPGDYKRYMKEIQRLTSSIKPKDAKGNLAELEGMADELNSPDISVVPEGLDSIDWVSLKLGVPVTKRAKDEIVHCETRARDFAHGISHGSGNGLNSDVINAEIINEETRGGESNRDGVFADEYSSFDVQGGEGSMIIHSQVEQYPHYRGFRVTGADVWPGCDSEDLANRILVKQHGEDYLEALSNQDAAERFIEAKKDKLEHNWESRKQLVRNLLRKFPELQEKYKDQPWINFLG